ncbi:hypothetical protein [uncultured Roseibium sp.]|uniref:hypothetical protein n=1 Tax=uncultured Roseibium sp. TaxID=1936171 RepID=UPI0026171D1D|nr:hypothetical protein [uncultured Roseibium sp.]
MKSLKIAAALFGVVVATACSTEAEACEGVTGHQYIAAWDKAIADTPREGQHPIAIKMAENFRIKIVERIEAQPEGRDVCIERGTQIFNGIVKTN